MDQPIAIQTDDGMKVIGIETTPNSEQPTVKSSTVMEWVFRVFTAGGLSVIMFAGTAKVNELIDAKLAPIIAKQERENEKLLQKVSDVHGEVQKITTAVEVISAIERERERGKR